jgi:urea transport system permease protein
MIMLGAYSTFTVQNFVRSAAPSYFDWYLILALPTAFLVCALVGVFLLPPIVKLTSQTDHFVLCSRR